MDMSPRGDMRRWYSLLDESDGCKPRVQWCSELDLVPNQLCNDNYTNSVVHNRGYFTKRVRDDSMGSYVNSTVLHALFLKVKYVVIVQSCSGTGRSY